MERGLFTLTKPEIQLASQVVQQYPRAQILLNKLATAVQDPQESVAIEVSEDDLEIIMDNLPIPQGGEDPTITSLRTKAQQQLTKFRS